MTQSVYITTTIPYVNSVPHIGHAFEFVIADSLARSHRALGASVAFQSGTDENAFKNVVAAKKAGIETQAYVDLNAARFQELTSELKISLTEFIRTTEKRHQVGVEKFWKSLNPEDLYTKSYEGLYCVGCEEFYLEKDLVEGVCPDHRTAPDAIAEENVFFRLSRYQDKLDQLISDDAIKIVPESRKAEVLGFVRQGLQDISLTRASRRTGGWGIPVPGSEDQVIYVWIDALVNYLTGQGYGANESWRDVWNEDVRKVHVIGKNVWKFHAVYWPALLLSAGLSLPNEIVIHGFLTSEGVKISKSLGNGVDPLEVVREFGLDAFKYSLLGCTPTFVDSDFSRGKIERAYTDDLANRFGNLYSRLRVLCEKAGRRPAVSSVNSSSLKTDSLVTEYRLAEASQRIWREVDQLNFEINDRKPWELLKSGGRELALLLDEWSERLYHAALALRSFTPEAAELVIVGLRDGVGDRILFPKLT